MKKSKEEVLKEVKKLFSEAEKHKGLADDYVKKARKLAMKVNLRLPSYLKRKFCKHCNTYFTPSNSRVRARNNMVVYYCATCKKYSRIRIK